jgi:hypothetical protein
MITPFIQKPAGRSLLLYHQKEETLNGLMKQGRAKNTCQQSKPDAEAKIRLWRHKEYSYDHIPFLKRSK